MRCNCCNCLLVRPRWGMPQLAIIHAVHNVMVGRELINRPVNACFEWSEVKSADNCEYTFECIVSAGELGRFNLGTWQRVNEAAH